MNCFWDTSSYLCYATFDDEIPGICRDISQGESHFNPRSGKEGRSIYGTQMRADTSVRETRNWNVKTDVTRTRKRATVYSTSMTATEGSDKTRERESRAP